MIDVAGLEEEVAGSVDDRLFRQDVGHVAGRHLSDAGPDLIVLAHMTTGRERKFGDAKLVLSIDLAEEAAERRLEFDLGNATVPAPLWHDGESSYHGRNDKVPEAVAKTLKNSLILIKPDKLNLVVGSESKYFGGSERKVRADFHYNGVRYNFVVTDPWIEAKCFAGKDGVYRVEKARLCISLAEVVNGIATKLVAAVITPDRVG